MKILLLVFAVIATTYIGYSFSRKYKQRADFFGAVVMLCQKFNLEINYSRERVKNILKNLDDKHKKKLYGVDKNYILYLEQQEELTKDLLCKNFKYLKEDERDLLLMFFKSLGRSDVESQSKEINNFQERFDNLTKTAVADNKKYGSLSLKLGFIAGLFIVVLFI